MPEARAGGLVDVATEEVDCLVGVAPDHVVVASRRRRRAART